MSVKKELANRILESDESDVAGFVKVLNLLTPVTNRTIGNSTETSPESVDNDEDLQCPPIPPPKQPSRRYTRSQAPPAKPRPTHLLAQPLSVSSLGVDSVYGTGSGFSTESDVKYTSTPTLWKKAGPRQDAEVCKVFVNRHVIDEKGNRIEASQLFPPVRKGSNILLHGEPGMGKSRMLDWLMEQWSELGWMSCYPCIFRLNISSLHELKSPVTLVELLTKHSSHKTDTDPLQLSKLLKSGQDHILLLLDDVDMHVQDGSRKECQVLDGKFRTLASDWCANIIKGNALPDCSKIATSSFHQITTKKPFDREVSLASLNWQEIRQFIQGNVPVDKIDQVLSTLKDDDVLLELCGNPRVCSAMCDLLQDCNEPLTYSRIICHLIWACSPATLSLHLNSLKHAGTMNLQVTRALNVVNLRTIKSTLHHPQAQKDSKTYSSNPQSKYTALTSLSKELLEVLSLLREVELNLERFFSSASPMSQNFLAAISHVSKSSSILHMKKSLDIPQISDKTINDIEDFIRKRIEHHLKLKEAADPRKLSEVIQLVHEYQSEVLARMASKLLQVQLPTSYKLTTLQIRARGFLTKHSKERDELSLKQLETELTEATEVQHLLKEYIKYNNTQYQDLKEAVNQAMDLENSLQMCIKKRQDLEIELDDITKKRMKIEEQLQDWQTKRCIAEKMLSESRDTEETKEMILSRAQAQNTQLEKKLTLMMQTEGSLKKRLVRMQEDVCQKAEIKSEAILLLSNMQRGQVSKIFKLQCNLERKRELEQTLYDQTEAALMGRKNAEIELNDVKQKEKAVGTQLNEIAKKAQDIDRQFRKAKKSEHLLQYQFEDAHVDKEMTTHVLMDMEKELQSLTEGLRIKGESTCRLQKQIEELRVKHDAINEQESLPQPTNDAQGLLLESDDMDHVGNASDEAKRSTAHLQPSTAYKVWPTAVTETSCSPITEIPLCTIKAVHEDTSADSSMDAICMLRCTVAQFGADELEKISKAVYSQPGLSLLQVDTLPPNYTKAFITFVTRKSGLKAIRSTIIRNRICLVILSSDNPEGEIYYANRGCTKFQTGAACLQEELCDFLNKHSLPSGVDVNNNKLSVFVTKEQEEEIGAELHTIIRDIRHSFGNIADEYQLQPLDHKLQVTPETTKGTLFPGCRVHFECSGESMINSTAGVLVKDEKGRMYVLSSCHGEKVYHCYLVEDAQSAHHPMRYEVKFVAHISSRNPFLDACLIEIEDEKVKEKCDPCVPSENARITLSGPYTGYTEDLKDKNVMKYGGKTKLTKGTIAFCTFNIPSADITDALVVKPGDDYSSFTEEGDSGSVIFNDTPEACQTPGVQDHQALAMHTSSVRGVKGISPTLSLAFRLDEVLEKLCIITGSRFQFLSMEIPATTDIGIQEQPGSGHGTFEDHTTDHPSLYNQRRIHHTVNVSQTPDSPVRKQSSLETTV